MSVSALGMGEAVSGREIKNSWLSLEGCGFEKSCETQGSYVDQAAYSKLGV